MHHLLDRSFNKRQIASVIDKPREFLEPRLFINEKLRRDVRDRILNYIFKKLNGFKGRENWLQDIVIGGSYTTNQYHKDSDLDIGILIDFEEFFRCNPHFKTLQYVYSFLRDRFLTDIFINGIRVKFFVTRRGKEYRSPGLYSVLNDYWIRRPFYFPLDLDPDEVFKLHKSLARLLYILCKKLLESGEGWRVKRFLDRLEAKKDWVNFERGDFNSLNIIYKYLEKFGLFNLIRRENV